MMMSKHSNILAQKLTHYLGLGTHWMPLQNQANSNILPGRRSEKAFNGNLGESNVFLPEHKLGY